jgi:copper transport protein
MKRLVTAGLVALALPGGASAHANLSKAEPGVGKRLSREPANVRLHFDQAVAPVGASIELHAKKALRRTGAAKRENGGMILRLPVGRLRAGGYTVRWRALSSDGHVISGVYTFGVKAPAPPQTAAFGARGPGPLDDALRWAYFAALALVLGGLAFRLLVLRGPLPHALERRFFAIAGIGLVAAVELGIVAFVVRGYGILNLPFGAFLYSDLSPLAYETRQGHAFVAMTLGYAGIGTLLFLAWLTDRSQLLWPALVLGVALAGGFSLSGHQAVMPGSTWLSEVADWLHLTAALLWLGGLVQLALAVWPAAPELGREAFLRFSRLAVVLVAGLVGGGAYLAILRLPELDDLWTEGYGQVLLVKLGLAGLALSWGGAHHFFVAPALERGTGGRAVAHLPRSLIGESAAGMAVLLVTAMLVNTDPPAKSITAGEQTRPAATARVP